MLGPPVEMLEQGYQLFSAVYFSRGTLPTKKVGVKERAPSGGTQVNTHKPGKKRFPAPNQKRGEKTLLGT